MRQKLIDQQEEMDGDFNTLPSERGAKVTILKHSWNILQQMPTLRATTLAESYLNWWKDS